MKHTARLPALVLAAVIALACGGKSSSPTEQTPIGDNPEPPPPVGDIKGYPIIAVDDANNMFLFGNESPGTIARTLKITGLPFLRYIVGIEFRPSDGKLYGVGNDARVYIIDPETGAATAVSDEPFTSEIGLFDHFGMGIDPQTERIRLVSTAGKNWSIDPDDGTAVREADPHYAAGDPNEGRSVRVAALDFISPNNPADSVWLAAGNPVSAVVYDAFNGELAEFIDPATGELTSLGPVEGLRASQCFTVAFDPSGLLWAFGTVAGVALGPEAAGVFALVRLSPAGVASFFAGEFGATSVTTAIQTMTFAKFLGGSNAVAMTRAGRGASTSIGWASTPAEAGPASWSGLGAAASTYATASSAVTAIW